MSMLNLVEINEKISAVWEKKNAQVAQHVDLKGRVTHWLNSFNSLV